MQTILYLTILFAVLQLLDGWTTWKALSSGSGREANLILAKLIDLIGLIPMLVVVKGVTIVAVSYVSWFYPSRNWVIGLMVLVVIYSGVVVNNWRR